MITITTKMLGAILGLALALSARAEVSPAQAAADAARAHFARDPLSKVATMQGVAPRAGHERDGRYVVDLGYRVVFDIDYATLLERARSQAMSGFPDSALLQNYGVFSAGDSIERKAMISFVRDAGEWRVLGYVEQDLPRPPAQAVPACHPGAIRVQAGDVEQRGPDRFDVSAVIVNESPRTMLYPVLVVEARDAQGGLRGNRVRRDASEVVADSQPGPVMQPGRPYQVRFQAGNLGSRDGSYAFSISCRRY